MVVSHGGHHGGESGQLTGLRVANASLSCGLRSGDILVPTNFCRAVRLHGSSSGVALRHGHWVPADRGLKPTATVLDRDAVEDGY